MVKISVLSPVYNTALYIEECVQSILRQSFSDYEFLICDDGSTDDTLKILSSFRDPRIRILKNKRNEDIPRTRNSLLQEAKGKYIAWLDADDVAYPDRLERQLAFLEKNSDVFLLSGWQRMIGEKGEYLSSSLYYPGLYENPYPYEVKNIPEALLFGCPVLMSTVMMRNTNEFLFDPELPPSEDYEFFIRISRRHKIVIEDEYFVKYRLHRMNSHKNQEKQKVAIKKIFENNLKYYGLREDDDISSYQDIFYCRYEKQNFSERKKLLLFLKKYYKAYKMKENSSFRLGTFDRMFRRVCNDRNYKIFHLLYFTFLFYPGPKRGAFLYACQIIMKKLKSRFFFSSYVR